MNCSGTNFDISPPYDANSLTIVELKYEEVRLEVRKTVSIAVFYTPLACAICSSYSKSVTARNPLIMIVALIFFM